MPAITYELPAFTSKQAEACARDRFGIVAAAQSLPSERDQNFLLAAPTGERFVLKISNASEDRAVIALQNLALVHIAERDPAAVLPRVRRSVDGSTLETLADAEGRPHSVRLLTWVEGQVLAHATPHLPPLLTSIGNFLGRIDRALESFDHAAAGRDLKWDPVRAGWISSHFEAIPDRKRRELVERLFVASWSELERLGPALRSGVIHNDANDYNVLVSSGDPYDRRVVSLLDFGDMLRTWTANECAVACAYAVLDKPDPLAAARALVAGYTQTNPLGSTDAEAIYPLLCSRLCVSVVNSAIQRREQPGNEYLVISERPAWDALERLAPIHPRLAQFTMRSACGLEPCAQASSVTAYLSGTAGLIGPVLEPDVRSVPTAVIDLGVGSADAWTPASAGVTPVIPAQAAPRLRSGRPEPVEGRNPRPMDAGFHRHDDYTWTPASAGVTPTVIPAQAAPRLRSGRPELVEGRNPRPMDAGFHRHDDYTWTPASAGVTPVVGVGRYDEVRGCYTSPIFSVPGNDGPEWRSVHLGVDLFAAVGTPVLAPLDAVVRSVADNAGAGDYGPTVILEHRAGENGPAFFTLYGHLSRDSVKGLKAGALVLRGTVFAKIGSPVENGGWPPHVHFQVIFDLLDSAGDFPGAARPSDRDVWLGICPDPNLILGIPGGVAAPRSCSAGRLLESRHEHLGPSLSVSYRRPLTIVRGWMQHLYDADGQVFLDAVNNVPHVGHCHPHVVDAGRRQMSVLNTNTRYLHESLGRYAERLTATLPSPLSVCFFVNSGSEANELALRLARAATGSRETIVVDVGYHGNTTSLIEISPYKFDGPGGSGPAPHVHKVPTPDIYRGLYRRGDGDAGRKYAGHVAEAVDRIVKRGLRPGAFIAESILSCAGQIVLPPGYLSEAYKHVRQAGGVCIADEVQVGFGRTGTHFWAFETQGVVPDIVTLGKPIGNGHPLGAVITTPAIARGFANGMEYFNTFGGNPVSCAIGMAVLDVMERERLQEHAFLVGGHLLARLDGLKHEHSAIGDVRGLGLFVGVELVRGGGTLDPDGALADLVANRMRDRGVLVSTDGPFHNVLKIKPPLVFDDRDVELLAATLDTSLRELE